MSLNNYTPGPGYAAEFQVSANPWVTSSVVSGIIEYSFPFVSSFFAIKNNSGSFGSIAVGFTRNGITSTGNYFPLATGESFSGDFRLKTLFVSGSGATVSLLVGLTSIMVERLPTITASNGWNGVG